MGKYVVICFEIDKNKMEVQKSYSFRNEYLMPYYKKTLIARYGFHQEIPKKYEVKSVAQNALKIIQYPYSPPWTLLFRAIEKNRVTQRATRRYSFHLPNDAWV